MSELLPLYFYRATIRKVYDGDTIRADINLGFGTLLEYESFRLYGIDTPEVTGESKAAGIRARDFVRELLPLGTVTKMRSFQDKQGKYGRYLAVFYLPNGQNLNQILVDSGHAVAFMTGDA